MADRELRKMKRTELLEMMIRQGKAVGALREQLEQTKQQQADTEAEMRLMEETFERLRNKLDQKDEELQAQAQQWEETFERLKAKLDQKDEEFQAQARQMEETSTRLKKRLDDKDLIIHDLRAELEEARAGRDIQIGDSGAIAEAALRLSNVVEDAQKATDRYLELVRSLARIMREDD